MAGFVDVTGWTAEEVRRLGHADDDYEEPVMYKKPARRTARVQRTIAVRDLAALAFMAQRINGTLYKDAQVYDEAKGGVITVKPNKEIMRENLELVVKPSDEDYAKADDAMSGVQGDLTVRLLKGQQVNDFFRNLVELTQKEVAFERDCGLMAFLPKTYEGQLARENKQVAVATMANTSQYLGREGDKITLDFVLVDKRYLQQYNCWSIFGHDGNNNCVQFLTQHENLARNGRIQGKIKRTSEDQFRGGAKVTALNYVKAV